MKNYIITEAQVQALGNAVANVPTAQGMKVIDILRQLVPLAPMSKESSKEIEEALKDELRISEEANS